VMKSLSCQIVFLFFVFCFFFVFDAPNHDNDGTLLNYIVLESKNFIYPTQLNKTSLPFKSLFERIKNTETPPSTARTIAELIIVYSNTRCPHFFFCLFVLKTHLMDDFSKGGRQPSHFFENL